MVDGWGDGFDSPGDSPDGWGADAWPGADCPSDPPVVPAHLLERDAAWRPDDDVPDGLCGLMQLDDLYDAADDDVQRALRESALLVEAERALVVPDDGEAYAMVREPGRGWMPTVAGTAPGPELARALPSGASATVDAVSDLELGEVAAACQRLMSWARAVQAAAVTELSRRPSMAPAPSGRKYASASARSCTALELTDPLRLTSAQAENVVVDSVQLVDDFPSTHAALTAGLIDERRARIILSELGRQDRDVAAAVEAAVIPHIEGMNTRQLRRRIKALVCMLAPVAAEERRRQAAEARHARVTPADDGMAWLESLMPAEDAMAWKAVLEAGQKTLKRRDAAAGDPNARTADQRRADVLAGMAWAAMSRQRVDSTLGAPDDTEDGPEGANTSEGMDGMDDPEAEGTRAGMANPASGAAADPADPGDRADPASGAAAGASDGAAEAEGHGCPRCHAALRLSSAHGRPVTVQVTVPLSTLIGLDEHPGELAGYGPVPADVARHLSVAGVWQWVGTDDVTGEAVSHGRTRYTPSRDLSDHVILRDRTCRAPGCDASAQLCELDHTIVYPIGGTDACNLGLFCRKHHLLKHHTRWRVEQPEPGVFVWTSPTGRTMVVTPTRTGSDRAQPDTARPRGHGRQPPDRSSVASDIPPF